MFVRVACILAHRQVGAWLEVCIMGGQIAAHDPSNRHILFHGPPAPINDVAQVDGELDLLRPPRRHSPPQATERTTVEARHAAVAEPIVDVRVLHIRRDAEPVLGERSDFAGKLGATGRQHPALLRMQLCAGRAGCSISHVEHYTHTGRCETLSPTRQMYNVRSRCKVVRPTARRRAMVTTRLPVSHDTSKTADTHLKSGFSSACGELPFADGTGAAEAICLTALLYSGRAGLREGNGSLDVGLVSTSRGQEAASSRSWWAAEAGI